MAQEIRPGISVTFTLLAARSRATGAAALLQIAAAMKREATQSLGRQQHPYRTPTPARPGGPPAKISGTLQRCVDYTQPAPNGAGWECRVGTTTGLYPWYSRRTPSSEYGMYLEDRYPWLRPAFRSVAEGSKAAVIARFFAEDWQHI